MMIFPTSVRAGEAFSKLLIVSDTGTYLFKVLRWTLPTPQSPQIVRCYDSLPLSHLLMLESRTEPPIVCLLGQVVNLISFRSRRLFPGGTRSIPVFLK